MANSPVKRQEHYSPTVSALKQARKHAEWQTHVPGSYTELDEKLQAAHANLGRGVAVVALSPAKTFITSVDHDTMQLQPDLTTINLNRLAKDAKKHRAEVHVLGAPASSPSGRSKLCQFVLKTLKSHGVVPNEIHAHSGNLTFTANHKTQSINVYLPIASANGKKTRPKNA